MSKKFVYNLIEYDRLNSESTYSVYTDKEVFIGVLTATRHSNEASYRFVAEKADKTALGFMGVCDCQNVGEVMLEFEKKFFAQINEFKNLI